MGSLEVASTHAPLQLRGLHQRAVLGYLLMRPGAAVAVSDLVAALWGGRPPSTARKMLQNAVAGVRRAMIAAGAPGADLLITHPPGYRLDVPADRIDLWRFRKHADQGRARFERGDWSGAAVPLRAALALRRGPILAELVEEGISWPELQAEESAWLSVVEDLAEATLALGRHQEAAAQLEAVLTGGRELVRERMCGLLMLALYRAGRQADALAVYRRTKTALVEQLGLDPGRDLQDLERAILAHDPVLAVPGGRGPASAAAGASPPAAARDRPCADEPEGAGPRGIPVGGIPVGGAAAGGERRPVTVVLVRLGLGSTEDPDPEAVHGAWTWLSACVEQAAARHGGLPLTGMVGPVRGAVFGAARVSDDDSELAITAAEDLCWALTAGAAAPPDGSGPLVQLAVASGEALVRRHDGAAVEVTGGLLDRALELLATAAPGEIRACEKTLAAWPRAEAAPRAASPDGDGGVLLHLPVRRPATEVMLVERHRELQLLTCAFDEVRRGRRAQLLTVVGEPGIGRSRLVREFVGRLERSHRAGRPQPAGRCVQVRVRRPGAWTLDAVVAEIVAALERRPVRGPARPGADAGARHDLPMRSHRLILEAAAQAPLVIVVEDLHKADGPVLDYIADLTVLARDAPLLVLVTARSELLTRRPHWGGGQAGSACTVALGPLSDRGAEDLLRAMLESGRRGAEWRDLVPELIRLIGGNPRFAVEYVGHLSAARYPAGPNRPADALGVRTLDLPLVVHRMIAAWLDTLPPRTKTVLQDAAVLGDIVCAGGVAAMSGGRWQDVTEHLRLLDTRDLLRRAPRQLVQDDPLGEIYVFRYGSVRQVAYEQLPREVRAEKHARIAAWLRRTTVASEEFYEHHLAASRLLAEPDRARIPGGVIRWAPDHADAS
ncbi:BTAD domain-containing putative transcriptional regulator [Dactylosporangium sp. CA-092794]|uniref:BTAD domain-containing putative transcriptional regulator n=1 Tax=Dactylosporangium sp. CA-092794 TaxID=3239929 RepID=UPI003D90C179